MHSTDQLSRKIALHFEPEPGICNAGCSGLRSSGGFWVSSYIRGTEPQPEYEFVARPYTDPEISMRLLEWIIEHDKRAIPDERIIQSYFEIRDRKQIALEFAKAAGIEEEE